MPTARYIIGCMTGTSIDALDCAIVKIRGSGLTMRPTFIAHRAASLGRLRSPLRALADQTPMSAGTIAELLRDFAVLHARACEKLWLQCNLPGRPHLISVHGQTVYHAPPVSWQLFAPQTLAALTGCRVVSDLRAADLAAGGQGAPLTPLADGLLFPSNQPTAVVNLGGFCNITFLPARNVSTPLNPASLRGRDLFPCNHLLNALARAYLCADYDRNGVAASRGWSNQPSLPPSALVKINSLFAHPDTPTKGARSLGTGDESIRTVLRIAQASGVKRHGVGPVLAAVCDALAAALMHAANSYGATRLILAGGGAKNNFLAARTLVHAREYNITLQSLPMPLDAREAAGWAVLGALHQDGVHIAPPRM
jgi:anhydro-N-acetylmuramic acid kinase